MADDNDASAGPTYGPERIRERIEGFEGKISDSVYHSLMDNIPADSADTSTFQELGRRLNGLAYLNGYSADGSPVGDSTREKLDSLSPTEIEYLEKLLTDFSTGLRSPLAGTKTIVEDFLPERQHIGEGAWLDIWHKNIKDSFDSPTTDVRGLKEAISEAKQREERIRDNYDVFFRGSREILTNLISHNPANLDTIILTGDYNNASAFLEDLKFTQSTDSDHLTTLVLAYQARANDNSADFRKYANRTVDLIEEVVNSHLHDRQPRVRPLPLVPISDIKPEDYLGLFVDLADDLYQSYVGLCLIHDPNKPESTALLSKANHVLDTFNRYKERLETDGYSFDSQIMGVLTARKARLDNDIGNELADYEHEKTLEERSGIGQQKTSEAYLRLSSDESSYDLNDLKDIAESLRSVVRPTEINYDREPTPIPALHPSIDALGDINGLINAIDAYVRYDASGRSDPSDLTDQIRVCEDLKEVLEDAGDFKFIPLVIRLGNLYLEKAESTNEVGDVSTAAGYFNEADMLNSGHVDALFGLGRCDYMRGNKTVAKPLFEAAQQGLQGDLQYSHEVRLDQVNAYLVQIDPAR